LENRVRIYIADVRAARHDNGGQGFDLKQVIAEYRGLRASVLGLWNSSTTAVTGDEVAELIRFNDTIDQLIAEVLTRYIDRATQYSDRFIAILGHDLRNPLNAISASAFLLQEGAQPDERHARSVSLILKSCQRIGRLVNDLLDFARSRLGGPLPLTKTSTHLGEICRSVLEEVKAAHPDRVLELQTIGDLSGEWDKERLAQLVSNLAANAIEHGGGERVHMVVRDQAALVVLEINNRGDLSRRSYCPRFSTRLFTDGGTPRMSRHAVLDWGCSLRVR
jgi:signal transduction histidine kinase